MCGKISVEDWFYSVCRMENYPRDLCPYKKEGLKKTQAAKQLSGVKGA